MSDTDFVDIGDELVVSISGYPVGKAWVQEVGTFVKVAVGVNGTEESIYLNLPLNFKDYDTVDGVAHGN